MTPDRLVDLAVDLTTRGTPGDLMVARSYLDTALKLNAQADLKDKLEAEYWKAAYEDMRAKWCDEIETALSPEICAYCWEPFYNGLTGKNWYKQVCAPCFYDGDYSKPIERKDDVSPEYAQSIMQEG